MEGYWYDGDTSDTTHPIPRPAEKKIDQEIIDRLREILNCVDEEDEGLEWGEHPEGFLLQKKSYLGSSSCRLCKRRNGSTEFVISHPDLVEVFRVPEGFIHYLEEHQIQLSERFRKFLNHHGADYRLTMK